MSKEEIKELKQMFSYESGFGDPEARRNAELRLQTLLAEKQEETGRQLNRLTLLLVIVAAINAILFAVDIFKN